MSEMQGLEDDTEGEEDRLNASSSHSEMRGSQLSPGLHSHPSQSTTTLNGSGRSQFSLHSRGTLHQSHSYGAESDPPGSAPGPFLSRTESQVTVHEEEGNGSNHNEVRGRRERNRLLKKNTTVHQ
jgi:hypothetical protein